MRLLPLSNGEYANVSDEDFMACLGKMPWHKHKDGYAQYNIDRSQKVLLHVFIATRMRLIGQFDHEDRDRLNCQRDNLREATAQENARNRNPHIGSVTGVKGVSWHKKNGKFRADITINGKMLHLGTFNTIDEAITVRRTAELKYFGEFAG